MLYKPYRAGAIRSRAAGVKAPYAYIFGDPARSRAGGRAARVAFAFAGVRVYPIERRDDYRRHVVRRRNLGDSTDQEFAASAREVLDVQKYRTSRVPGRSSRSALRRRRLDAADCDGRDDDDGGDAAGGELCGRICKLGRRRRRGDAGALRQQQRADAAAFDSVAGLGFDASAAAKGHCAARGRITGTGSGLA
jgi:hypothetical protein